MTTWFQNRSTYISYLFPFSLWEWFANLFRARSSHETDHVELMRVNKKVATNTNMKIVISKPQSAAEEKGMSTSSSVGTMHSTPSTSPSVGVRNFPTCTQCLKCNRYIHRTFQNPNYSGKYNPAVQYPRNRELVCLDSKVESYSIFECKICKKEYPPDKMPAQCAEPTLCLANPPCNCVHSYLVQCFTQIGEHEAEADANAATTSDDNEKTQKMGWQWRHKASSDSARSTGTGTGVIVYSAKSSSKSKSSGRRKSFFGSFSSRRGEYAVQPVPETPEPAHAPVPVPAPAQ